MTFFVIIVRVNCVIALYCRIVDVEFWWEVLLILYLQPPREFIFLGMTVVTTCINFSVLLYERFCKICYKKISLYYETFSGTNTIKSENHFKQVIHFVRM